MHICFCCVLLSRVYYNFFRPSRHPALLPSLIHCVGEDWDRLFRHHISQCLPVYTGRRHICFHLQSWSCRRNILCPTGSASHTLLTYVPNHYLSLIFSLVWAILWIWATSPARRWISLWQWSTDMAPPNSHLPLHSVYMEVCHLITYMYIYTH